MSNYQRSDQQVMLTDTFLAIKEMQESVQVLSAKISALSETFAKKPKILKISAVAEPEWE